MSGLSVHYNASGNRNGFGEFLKKCYDAKSPVGIVYSVNGNIHSDIVSNSPSTKWVYRRQTDCFNRLPDGFLVEDPVVNATKWISITRDPADQYRTQLENWKLNQPDWADPLNEPVADTPEKAKYLNTWMLTALEIAQQNGIKLALFSFPTGTPPIEYWQYLIPALKRGKELGAILSMHAYWGDGHPGDQSWEESFQYNAIRYRQIYEFLPPEAQLPIILSEASPGNGYDQSSTETGAHWVQNMVFLDEEIIKDRIVLGACGYQLGGQESNLVSVLGDYGDYISTHPTPEESMTGSPRVQYKRIYILIHPSLSGQGYYSAVDKNNMTVGPSADDAGLGDLTNKTVVVVNPSLWGGDASMKSFFNQYYPNTIYKSVVVSSPRMLDDYLKGM